MRLVTVLAFCVALVACGSATPPDGIPSPTPPAASTPSAQDVYVLNFFGDEQGSPAQKPADLVISEFSTMNKLRWDKWGPDNAVGHGMLTGSWCLPDCLEKPYEAKVTLATPTSRQGRTFFTSYTIEPGDLQSAQEQGADLIGTLQTP
ncbi:hypothetical protein [Herbidospora mongoliensis]|uniref:hypothetical protein n=1 Tax=Herbidospora mongoliensis TaxID=688067 RepID=UPI0008362B84|nr:hypothetical protein [Herbidospora mongoliensis]